MQFYKLVYDTDIYVHKRKRKRKRRITEKILIKHLF